MSIETEVLGRRIGKQRAAAAQAEFERIRQKYGRLTSELVLTETQRQGKKSPLWWAFDWNVKSAARKHWLNQAGHLIREVQVRIISKPEKTGVPAPMRFYTFVREPHGGSYVPTAEALSDEQVRLRLLDQALGDIEAMRRKYFSLVWLAKQLDELKSSVRRKRRAA